MFTLFFLIFGSYISDYKHLNLSQFFDEMEIKT